MTTDTPEPSRLTHRRLHDHETFDEIRIRIVPRYKTSGMSGDEWRHHAQVDFMFKGTVVAEDAAHDIDAAVQMLGGMMIKACDNGIPDGVLTLEKTKCDQPSCANDAVVRYVLKRLTSERGQYLHPDEGMYFRHYRKFCAVHARRGDCGREDADANYEPMGSGPEVSTNTQESPAGFGGFVTINAEDC